LIPVVVRRAESTTIDIPRYERELTTDTLWSTR